jgi:hypothetical protein
MALALAHLMAHVPGSGALEYAYDATDSIIESKMGCFWWESYFGGLIRLHRLLRQSSIPQRYIDEALLTQINDNVSKLLYVQTLGWCFPPDWLAEIARELAGNAIELAEVDREGARRLLKIAAGLEPEWNAFGVHEAHAYIALASHQTGLEVTSPPLAQSLGQMACLDAEGDGSPRFGHILEDIARTNPQLALHVYPVLRTNQQRLSWLSAVGDAPKKQGPLFLRQIPSSEDEVVAARAADPNRPPFLRQVPDFDARLAAVARSMPKGYNRAKSLGMVSRILRKL